MLSFIRRLLKKLVPTPAAPASYDVWVPGIANPVVVRGATSQADADAAVFSLFGYSDATGFSGDEPNFEALD